MAELKELFEMITNDVEPDLDAWREQEERRRQRQRRRRGAAFAVAAVLALLAVAAAFAVRNTSTTEPLTSPAPPLSTTTALVAFDVATGEATPILKNVEPYGAAVSHDGAHIAFVRNVKGHGEIFIANIDGSGAGQVTGLPGQPGCGCGSFDPTWSPDDRQIAFTGTNAVGNRGIWILTVATGRTRQLTHDGGDSFETSPAWSPDGSRIAYAIGSSQAEPAGSGEIVTSSVSGTGPTRIVARRPGATDPAWSPEGDRIAFVADSAGGTSVFVTETTGDASAGPLLLDDADESAPAWSPDGTQIAMTRENELTIVDMETGGGAQSLGAGGDPTWSPDGATIYAWRTG